MPADVEILKIINENIEKLLKSTMPKPVPLDPCGKCNQATTALPFRDGDKIFWKCSRCGEEI